MKGVCCVSCILVISIKKAASAGCNYGYIVLISHTLQPNFQGQVAKITDDMHLVQEKPTNCGTRAPNVLAYFLAGQL